LIQVKRVNKRGKKGQPAYPLTAALFAVIVNVSMTVEATYGKLRKRRRLCMRRVLTVLTVVVLVEAMLVAMAAPALAQATPVEPIQPPPNCEHG